MHIQLIAHGSEEYEDMLRLRKEVLLDPIDVPFSFIKQEKEAADFLVAAFDNAMIGCCVLTPLDAGVLQLRQMAVRDELQGRGVGQAIISFAEKVAKEKGFKALRMHARDAAVPFYEKAGYKIISDAFIEVGILHYKMQKELL